MGQIIAIHSFRGGTGKSNTAANLGALLAAKGQRVGLVDTDIQSPGIHAPFGFNEGTLEKTLNDYLWGRAAIDQIAYPVKDIALRTPGYAYLAELPLWLIPSSIRTAEIARVLREGYDVRLLTDGLHELIRRLQLDFLLIDTHPGLNEETLLAMALADTLLIVLRPDVQDFQGTAVTVDIAQRLEVPRLWLMLNKVLARYDSAQLTEEVRSTYGVPVIGVLPFSEEVAFNGSGGLFALLYPQHPWSLAVARVAEALRS